MIPKYFIGPMSRNVVDCLLEWSWPVGIIASRRQIDFMGGYVGWTTKTFHEYVRERNQTALLCRDHGGEFQGSREDNGTDSYVWDSQYFDVIHVDPFKIAESMEDAAERTATHMTNIFQLNPQVKFEVGTEEAIFPYTPSQLEAFLGILDTTISNEVRKNLLFAVVQSGTGLDVSRRVNTGVYNETKLAQFIKVVKKFGLRSKEHNGDYLSHLDLRQRFDLGLDAVNIAPEFGQIEAEYYASTCVADDKLFNQLYNICYHSGRWKRWGLDVYRMSKMELIMTCCHYVVSTDDFAELKKCFPEADSSIRKRIMERLGWLYGEDYSI